MARFSSPRALGVLLVLTLSSIWGCSKPSLPPQTDAAAARAGLTTALTAWKNNEPMSALQGREPPIFFTDFDQRAGRKLTAFTIDEDHRIYGRSIQLKATLTLQGPGTSTEKSRIYMIDIATAIVIVPEG